MRRTGSLRLRRALSVVVLVVQVMDVAVLVLERVVVVFVIVTTNPFHTEVWGEAAAINNCM